MRYSAEVVMRPTRFDIAKKDIVLLFEQLDEKVFSPNQISTILENNRKFWRLPERLTANAFINLLLEKTELKKYEFKFPIVKITRYSWGEASIFELAMSLRKNAYFTHYSALFLHGLTEQIPKKIYLNVEQNQKVLSKKELIQENIDRAFSRVQRISNNVAIANNYSICLLNGRFTNRLGVEQTKYKKNVILHLTDIERTLIDITVRPSYSGGVFEVLRAFRNASGHVSINKLCSYLKKLEYVYPYHQAIGFYLEKSGKYKESQIKLLERFEIKCNFYLTYQMKTIDYSNRWKLYYPKDF